MKLAINKGIMLLRSITIGLCAILVPYLAIAQQFVGLAAREYASIQQVPYNPAWVNGASTGTEVQLFGLSAMAGTNAYSITRKYLTSGGLGNGSAATENKDIYKDMRNNKKYAWGNVDLLGPAASFNIKGIHNVGIYTRFREIARAGNIGKLEFELMGEMLPEYYYVPLDFKNTGFSTHAFAEVGFSYGRELINDYTNKWRGGITVKYLMGFCAGSVYTTGTRYVQANEDSLASLAGDITALFTYNLNPINGPTAKIDPAGLTQRAGRGSLGLDIGLQYEYHENANPNEESPYTYSIAASITDIGAITYFADTGSGSYTLYGNLEAIKGFDVREGETSADYVARLVRDSLLVKTDDPEKFRVGLPTAFRLNADYNVTPAMNIAVNILLNMRGNTRDIYRAAYTNYFNITPTFGQRRFKVSIPFTFVGYQTVVLGAIIQSGPFYIGTNSLFSTLLSKNLKNADAFMGLMFKLHKDRRNYYTY
ncbi:DUF5723 family protein [Polluticoccus soli]|uniref:DUF5723 family protein n=1 Tax=Polluticoccus soli TaxID=3034150 RepID=UPI0023E32A3F|nr:DUF5723 family protein [Flavipsychrobacter sp. JY13-12]